MTLLDFINRFSNGEEITVVDNIYDMETYFYAGTPSSKWDKAIFDLASKLEVLSSSEDSAWAEVNLSELIERNIDNPELSELFYDVDIDSIMDDIDNILAGAVSEEWLEKFVNCLT